MQEMGIQTYIPLKNQGPIITTFYYPKQHSFSFQKMYQYIKERDMPFILVRLRLPIPFGWAISGEIYREDIEKLCEIMREFWRKTGNEKDRGCHF